jgi:hypothetical protein
MFRPEPALPVTAMKTYRIAAPLATHWRPATCAEVECPEYLNGWISDIDEATELGQRQATFIRCDRTRAHAEERLPSGLTRFSFPAGTTPFAGPRHDHRVQNGRPERFLERDGDWRGNPTGWQRELGVDDWADSFANHQDKLAARLERG